MDKVPSVFATAMKSESPSVTTPPEADGEEFMEIDDLDTAICDKLVVRGRQMYKCVIMLWCMVKDPHFLLAECSHHPW